MSETLGVHVPPVAILRFGRPLDEGLVYDEEGQMQTALLLDYLVPTVGEVPPMELEHLEIPSPTTPNGVKGVGEGSTVGAPTAVANAVCDALGVELNELPLPLERVREGASR